MIALVPQSLGGELQQRHARGLAQPRPCASEILGLVAITDVEHGFFGSQQASGPRRYRTVTRVMPRRRAQRQPSR